jgi:hypothetical protein
MRRVILHIDRLVLKGIRLDDKVEVARSLREELAHQFSELGVRQASSMPNAPHMSARRTSIPAAAEPGALGVHAARGIVRTMRR